MDDATDDDDEDADKVFAETPPSLPRV